MKFLKKNSCGSMSRTGIILKEGKKWVLKSLNEKFRSFKSRIKRDHYYPYATDDERLKKRLREVPLEDFKILLKYWADEKIAETAKKNSQTRSQITETHTTGPRSFAQVTKLMKLEKKPVDGEEQLTPISDADIYLETRKRDDKCEYKLPEYVLKAIKDKITNIKKSLENEGVEAANMLVHDGKEHIPSWLIDRLIRNKESKSKSSATSCTSSIPDQYVSDLTAKIQSQLQQEMDEKLDQKVQEMVKKLADKNPDLKSNIENSEQSTEVSIGDDIITP